MAQGKAGIMFKQLPIPAVNSQFPVRYTHCVSLYALAFSRAEAKGFFHVPEECVRKAVFMLRDFINITSQAAYPETITAKTRPCSFASLAQATTRLKPNPGCLPSGEKIRRVK